MRRFNQATLFDRLAGAGRLDITLVERAATAIARFHRDAERHPAADGTTVIAWVIDDNERGLADGRAAATRCRAWLSRLGPWLDARAQAGFVRACHGDLHLRNICLVDGAPTLFDGIEFDPRFSVIDVGYDIAFLLMDLLHRDLLVHAARALARWVAETDDVEVLAALPLFLGLRAMVRAKVETAAAELAGHTPAEPGAYLALAECVLNPAPPCLVAIGGLSGTGKSTLARPRPRPRPRSRRAGAAQRRAAQAARGRGARRPGQPRSRPCRVRTMNDCDVLVVGAGMAGAAAGYHLAERVRVIVVEREDAPGYHSTGRSAAMFTETYGPQPIRLLTGASGPFLRNPPPGFAEVPLLCPRGVLFVARRDQVAVLDGHEAAARATGANVERLEVDGMLRVAPVLRRDYVGAGMIEPDACDIDVNALHQGFLRGFRQRGGRLVPDAEVRGITRHDGRWRVETKAGNFTATTLVDAAGAWADEIAALAGLPRRGLVPKRRTAFTFDPPARNDVRALPLCYDVDEQFYFKPDAGRLMGSLADETPSPPCDAQPEDIDVATAIERIEAASIMTIHRPVRTWAGLRSFFKDKAPALGPDPAEPTFLWCAGQGGYGIQTSPANGELIAAMALGASIPAWVASRGLDLADVTPARLKA